MHNRKNDPELKMRLHTDVTNGTNVLMPYKSLEARTRLQKKWRSENPEKIKIYRSRWRDSHREEERARERKWENSPRGKERRIRKRYKIRGERLLAILTAHHAKFVDGKLFGKCGICGVYSHLHVDHDHSCCPAGKSCGKCVRGLLCKHHNRGLGEFQDNIKHMRSAILYLKRWENAKLEHSEHRCEPLEIDQY